MDKQSLFNPISPSMYDLVHEIQKPILVNQFKMINYDVKLMLTDTYIVMYQNNYNDIPTHFCKLSFAVKSQFLFQSITTLQEQPKLNLTKPLGIKLQRQNCSQIITFLCQSPSALQQWMIQLQKKINQRNFHKLFKAKKKIGKGAFATVYLAQRLRDKKMVAVKAFSKQKQYSGDKGRQSLQNQIKIMRHIAHPNIMRLQGVYQTENSIYVILQYLEGVQLNDILKSKKTLTDQQKSAIVRNLLKGLEYLNENRIIHRDLKPENIMFRNQNATDAVICDFGLATFADAEKYLFVRCGTPGFVSPQIINIKDMTVKSDPISDVFSVGLIFHYLLLGHSIFPGKKYNQILCQNRVCEFDFNQNQYNEVNGQAFDLLKRMLQKEPSKRISPKLALNHSYFKNSLSHQMDIEQPQKRTPFKQLSNFSYHNGLKNIQNQQTPSIMGSNYEPSRLTYNLVDYQYRNQNQRRYR